MAYNTDNYLPKLKDQLVDLNGRTALIWVCGVMFTRLAAGVWFGDRPVFVIAVLLAVVYLYMHLGYYLTMLIRFPIVLLFLYLGHTHLIQPGDFLITNTILLSWKHLLLMWAAMNFSFIFHAEDYPFKCGTLDSLVSGTTQNLPAGAKSETVSGKVIALPKRRAAQHWIFP